MLSSPRGRAVPSVEDGVHAVSANFAFLGLHSQIEPYLDDCSKRSYVVSANFAPYSIMMPKMSPYRDMFNQAIERLREAGMSKLPHKRLRLDLLIFLFNYFLHTELLSEYGQNTLFNFVHRSYLK